MYEHPKWTHYKKDFDVLDIEQIRQHFSATNDVNHTRHKTNQEHYKQMLTLAVQVYGAGSRQHSYLLKNQPPAPPDLNSEFRKLEKHYNRYCEDEARKEKQRIQAQQYRERVEVANAQLEAMGYVPYEDFKPTRAITFLKEVEEDSTPKLEAPTQAIPYTQLPHKTVARIRVVETEDFVDDKPFDEYSEYDVIEVVFSNTGMPCFIDKSSGKRSIGYDIYTNGNMPIAIEEILETP